MKNLKQIAALWRCSEKAQDQYEETKSEDILTRNSVLNITKYENKKDLQQNKE